MKLPDDWDAELHGSLKNYDSHVFGSVQLSKTKRFLNAAVDAKGSVVGPRNVLSRLNLVTPLQNFFIATNADLYYRTRTYITERGPTLANADLH